MKTAIAFLLCALALAAQTNVDGPKWPGITFTGTSRNPEYPRVPMKEIAADSAACTLRIKTEEFSQCFVSEGVFPTSNWWPNAKWRDKELQQQFRMEIPKDCLSIQVSNGLHLPRLKEAAAEWVYVMQMISSEGRPSGCFEAKP